MSEVSIKLVGGLGNYMFQIACAYSYALKNKKTMVLTSDDSVVIHKHVDNYKDNVLSKIDFLKSKDFSSFAIYNEPGFNFSPIPSVEGNLYINGYFQTAKYFESTSNEIKNLFSYPTSYVENVKAKYNDFLSLPNTGSIHVRRGDYLNSPDHHPGQTLNYYMKAIKQMPSDTVFLIFSDDIEWCKANFPELPEKFRFCENASDHESLLLMSLCKHNIICNSTFSWWGAWLNNNESKIVVAPKTWFGPAYANHNTSDLYCENWIKL